MRSAIAIRPKALGLTTKSRIDGDLATPVLRQRGPPPTSHLCQKAVGDHPAIVFLVILSPLCIVLKSATEAAPDLPDTLRQVWRAPP